jgi:GxxExxY protein
MALIPVPDINPITSVVIGAAIEVHRYLGPGLLESVYVECLARELLAAEVPFERQKRLKLFYKGLPLNLNLTLDLVVKGKVIVEVKSIAQFAPVHRAQLLTYLRLTGCPAGLLLNFNVPVLKQGVTRVLNNRQPKSSP